MKAKLITAFVSLLLSIPALAQEPSEYSANFATDAQVLWESDEINPLDVYLGVVERFTHQDRQYVLRTSAKHIRGLRIRGANVYITRFEVRFGNGDTQMISSFRGYLGSVGRAENKRVQFRNSRNVTRIIIWGRAANSNRNAPLQVWGL